VDPIARLHDQAEEAARDENVARAGLDALIAAFPGPAARLDTAGRVIVSNAASPPMIDSLNRSGGGLVALAGSFAANPASKILSLSVPGDGGAMATLEVVLASIPDGLVVLGRDMSLASNLRTALAESRKRYKDLVETSSDFAWETDANGVFSFVSPRGALGYRADELHGRPAASLLVNPVGGAVDPTQPSPFSSQTPLDRVEMWLCRADGSSACVEITATPLFSQSFEYLGARGMCHDVTEARENDAALADARNRERLLAYVVRAIRDVVEPASMLNAAATAATRALEAAGVVILRLDPDGFVPVAAAGAALPAGFDPCAGASAANDESGPIETVEPVGRMLTCVSRFRRAVNGAICLWRRPEQPAWSTGERDLTTGLADQIGIALSQVASHVELERLARADTLTGLLNRRTFMEELERRTANATRRKRGGMLAYVDLDNFKAVNDTHGHHRGDELLKALALMLQAMIREGDLVARLGGDEFALWFEDMDANAAAAKAEALVARADAAMYRIKRGSKSGYLIAPAVGEVQS
jgi:PAS domain S-box-containing protein